MKKELRLDTQPEYAAISFYKHLVKDKAATVLILGCTELPLILDEDDNFDIDGKKVAIVDPTSAVARKVVTIATLVTKERGRK